MEEFSLDFTGKNLDDFYDFCRQESEKEIKDILVIGAIAKAEGVLITKKMLESNLEKEDIELNSLSDLEIIEYKFNLLKEEVIKKMIK
jgi:FKBP-type peptidyl-prolyl cis-trans isomerase (trigger factor)